ncbi:ATP-dependent helicase [uncultured Fusobacterium sp.]|uniref:UvrD-helicase domain-containing protein n=1 Tax=uncultured Fusobacterium sp. TaxID=159267 RepID=UPI0025FC7F2B|nr:ATP-dependent helicase [uncultured Fusobacterium sp.]
MALQEIESKDKIDINSHFKIVAGPGAGKTTFLINQIKNIIENSNKVNIYRKIACITYTNVAVENIIKRLDYSLEVIEVATIHSFLYKHVLKPYLWVLQDKYKFNLKEVKWYDEIPLGHSLLDLWRKKRKKFFLNEDIPLAKTLLEGNWKLNDDFSIQIIPNEVYKRKVKGKYFLEEEDFKYLKMICWEKGMISHDDVLYLSYEILKKSPRILEILRAKFPYILVDEFQDTNPFQTEIIKIIAKEESLVGIIGDECQSIYGFQGANVLQFKNFFLEGMKEYNILTNHRSTKEIIELLNYMRKESLYQKIPENKSGDKPTIIIGEIIKSYKEIKKTYSNEELYVVSYKENISKNIEYDVNKKVHTDFTYELLFNDKERGKRIFYIISAIEYAKQLNLKKSIHSMEKIYKGMEIDKSIIMKNLKLFIENYISFETLSITEFYNEFITKYCNFSEKITRGNIKDKYDNLKYNEIAPLIKLEDNKSNFKTIHKTKGEEVDNILILLDHEKFNENTSLNFLLNPDMEIEEHRVFYVAISRAKKRVFISIPEISEEFKEKLKNISFIQIK